MSLYRWWSFTTGAPPTLFRITRACTLRFMVVTAAATDRQRATATVILSALPSILRPGLVTAYRARPALPLPASDCGGGERGGGGGRYRRFAAADAAVVAAACQFCVPSVRARTHDPSVVWVWARRIIFIFSTVIKKKIIKPSL